jgi:acetyltransferase-like isoleucine patch superfamily enzyme
MQIKRFLQFLAYRFVTFGQSYLQSNPELASGLLTMGEYSYNTPKIVRHGGDKHRVYIGKFCSIADDVTIFVGGNHRTDWVSTYPMRIKFDLPGKYQDGHPASKGDVRIGSDVWIGRGATILSGVQIGHGAVIAAQALVIGNVAPYTIVGGNPAQVIKRRFSDEQIASLLAIAWWNWPLSHILASIDLLNQSNIDAFITWAQTNGFEP